MKRLNAVLAVLLTAVVGWLTRLYPIFTLSPMRGRFTPGVDFATWYALQHGRVPAVLPTVTYTSNLMNGTSYLGEFARVLLNAPLLLITGNTTLSDMLNFYATTPWSGLILLPSALLLGVRAIEDHAGREVRRYDPKVLYPSLYALSVLGFPSLLAFTSSSGVMDPFGWAFVGLIFYSLLKRHAFPRGRAKFTALALLFLFNLNIFHHTTALFVVLMLFGILLLQRRGRLPITPVRFSLASLYGLMLFAYIAYLTLSFNGYFVAFGATIGSLANGILGIGQPAPLGQLATTERFSLDRLAFRIVDVSLISIVFLYFGIALAKRRPEDEPRVVLSGFAIGTIISAVFVMAWGGFGAFFVRISALAAVVSVLGVGYILIHERPTVVRNISILCLAVIIVSPIAFAGTQPALQGTLTWRESSAIQWVGQHVSSQSPILSDSRIATPLIYYGFTSAIGFEDETTSLTTQEQLVLIYSELYHATSEDDVQRAICRVQSISGTQPRYLIYSDSFADDNIGVIGFLNGYPPASVSDQSVISSTWIAQKLYTNGPVSLFQLRSLQGTC